MDTFKALTRAIKEAGDYWLPGETHKAYHHRVALAALHAIRDPDELMIMAGCADGDWPHARETWIAMVDAIRPTPPKEQ